MTDTAGQRLLIANRGEVAVRVARAAAELGLPTCAVVAEDEHGARHVRLADTAAVLPGTGPGAYLDVAALVRVAREAGCTLLHPGWGFASEDPALPRACAGAGVTFVGPDADVLALLGDKAATRRLAVAHDVPVPRGSDGPVDADGARAVADELGVPVVVKALAGGGGRGLRVARRPEEVSAAVEACRRDARAAFGRDAVYVEELLHPVRHVEVQVVADGHGSVVAVGDRDCSLQRDHQKLVELAPAPHLAPALRRRLAGDAERLAAAAGLVGLATVEFLVAVDGTEDSAHRLIEINPRLQVEHPVTEEVLGRDLVAAQLRLALGATLADVGLAEPPVPRGHAVEARVCAERLAADGTRTPTTGTVTALSLPGGPGLRCDTHLEVGARVSSRYDPLLAKVVAHAPGEEPTGALGRLSRALAELAVDGVATNRALLMALLADPAVATGRWHTGLLEERLPGLVAAAEEVADAGRAATGDDDDAEPAGPGAGAAVDTAVPAGSRPVHAPTAGVVAAVAVGTGDDVAADTPLVLVEAMKLQHPVTAGVAAEVTAVGVAVGDEVAAGTVVAAVAPTAHDGPAAGAATDADLDVVRDDLAEVVERRRWLQDAARPEAVARRHAQGRRTARENLAELLDDADAFVEYGGFAVAAQRGRRSEQELIERTPADGLIGGIGPVNGDRVGHDRAQAVVLSYDYLVLAGTQGALGHRKKDRLFAVTERLRRPVVFFTEGGGGRPGDTDVAQVAGLDTEAFALWGSLSGQVPRIAVASGRCFAGNAVLFGASDVTIATPEATIGMGGPAMIEGGGLGRYSPEEVGPTSMQVPGGVIDVLAADDADAVRLARQALSYFQGPVADGDCADQRRLRHLVPEDRLRVYDVRRVVETLADTGSVLELRPSFAPGMVTALARLAGRPVGIVANDPLHLAGAITSDGADKAARFLQLCEAFDLPVVFLCDTPGIMVGPEAERTGLVRHAARLFLAGGALTVPFVTVVLRKGYGLGAQAMAGGSFRAPLATLSWPTGEFGGMGLEGAVTLALRRELAAIEDPAERQRVFDAAVATAYERGKALSMAAHFEIDDVIDPADTRAVVDRVLAAAPEPPPRSGRKAGYVDAW